MKFPKIIYPPAKICIYCGSSKKPLDQEHIIPLALDGNFILPEASCRSCSKKTSNFERLVARTNYGHYRVKENYTTRRKKKRQKLVTGYILEKNIKENIHINAGDLPNIFYSWKLPPPGIIAGREPSKIIPESKLEVKSSASCPAEINEILKTYSCGNLHTSQTFLVGPFLQLLAKIGHGFAHAITGGEYYQTLLPNIIIGNSEYLSHYVGGITNDYIPPNDYIPLTISVRFYNSCAYLIVRIQLLNIGSLPPYEVVAGYIPNHLQFMKIHEKKFCNVAISS